jgi:erythromycin esterase
MDTSMAETVLRLLERHGPDTRIVLGLHNVHIRKTPPVGEGPAGRFPAGCHLARALGSDYVAIAATSGSGRTVRGNLDPQQPNGFAFQDVPIPAAPEGSIERAFSDRAPALIADLRTAGTAVSDADAYTSILMENYFTDTPVLEAFDAVAYLANTTTTSYLTST